MKLWIWCIHRLIDEASCSSAFSSAHPIGTPQLWGLLTEWLRALYYLRAWAHGSLSDRCWSGGAVGEPATSIRRRWCEPSRRPSGELARGQWTGGRSADAGSLAVVVTPCWFLSKEGGYNQQSSWGGRSTTHECSAEEKACRYTSLFSILCLSSFVVGVHFCMLDCSCNFIVEICLLYNFVSA
jgi:hypothetical protein